MSDPSDRELELVLARRLREVAAERGIPLSHVADRAGIARSHLWAILASQRSATLELVQRLASVLEVAPVALLEDEPTGPRRPPQTARSRKPTR